MRTNAGTEVTTQELSRDQAQALFEVRCQDLLGTSSAEFLRRYDDGSIWQSGEDEAVTELALLVPFAR